MRERYYSIGDYGSPYFDPAISAIIKMYNDYPITILEENPMKDKNKVKELIPAPAYNLLDGLQAGKANAGDLSGKLEEITKSFSKAFSSSMPKMQVQTALQEITSIITVRNHLQSIVNGPVLKKAVVSTTGAVVQDVDFLVEPDEEKKLRKLLKKLDYEIVSRSLALLNIFESADAK